MTTRTTPARLAALTVAALLAVGASACGTSDGEKADSTTTTAESEKTTTTAAEEEDDVTTTEADDDDDVTTTSGSDEVTGDRDAYVQAMADGLGSIFGEGDGQAICLGEGWVDTIGLDVIQDAGLTPETFAEADDEMIDKLGIDEDTASDLYDVFGDCDIDLKGIFVELGTGGEGPTPEQEACVDALLTDDALRASFVAEYTGEELDDDPIDAVDSCFE